jgi:hypothetical protein
VKWNSSILEVIAGMSALATASSRSPSIGRTRFRMRGMRDFGTSASIFPRMLMSKACGGCQIG